MQFLIQESTRSFEILSNMSAQSFLLGTTALIVLIVGVISIIYSSIMKMKNKSPLLKGLNSDQKEIIELLLDIDEVPVNEITNLISIKNLNQELKQLKEKNLIKTELKHDQKYIILNVKD